MAERTVQAVLFDLGETLLLFGRLKATDLFEQAARCSYAYLKQLGQPIGRFGIYRFWNLWGIRLHLLASYLTGSDFDSLSILKRYGRKKGLTLSESEWEELNWQWYRPLAEKARIEPQTAETLDTLRRMGLRLGIQSNTFIHGSSLDRHLRQVGLLEFFDLRLYSYQFSFRKPDPRIFAEAARRLQTQPHQIAFVGDRMDKDVRGALRAGMIPVLKEAYTNRKKRVPAGVFRIQYLSELPDLIKRLNKDVARERSPSVSEVHEPPLRG